MSIFHPARKLLRKKQDNKKNNFLPNFGVNWVENKNGLQKDLKLSEWMSYPNSLMKLCLCFVVLLFRNIANFGNFWSNFCLIHSSYSFHDHFFAWNHGNTDMFFFVKHKNIVKKLNNIWMITFYIVMLGRFSNFWANICLVHSTCSVAGCILSEIIPVVGRYFSFRITQKSCTSLEIWKFLPKTNKNSQIWGKSRLYKTPESGNGTKMSDKKRRSVNSRYLENKKW